MLQELLVMVHEVVHVKAVQGISGTLPPSKKSVSTTSGTQDFQLKRGQFDISVSRIHLTCVTKL